MGIDRWESSAYARCIKGDNAGNMNPRRVIKPTGTRYYRVDVNGEEYVHDYSKDRRQRLKASKPVAGDKRHRNVTDGSTDSHPDDRHDRSTPPRARDSDASIGRYHALRRRG